MYFRAVIWFVIFVCTITFTRSNRSVNKMPLYDPNNEDVESRFQNCGIKKRPGAPYIKFQVISSNASPIYLSVLTTAIEFDQLAACMMLVSTSG